jgi:uncharacterized BrkB/YihY/UPF0761 family membrane protein
MNEAPEMRYAKSGDVYIAYPVLGEGGPVDYVCLPPLISNIDVIWESPQAVRFMRRLARLAQVGTRVPIYAVLFVVCVAFYWWTQHILLLGRVGWGQLFPVALATGVCVTGPAVFSALLFSGQIVSGETDYGSIGVVTVLLLFLIGLGVCLHLGAVAGHVWNERTRRCHHHRNS